MSELERQFYTLSRKFNTLLRIVQNAPIDLVCPQCLRGFPRQDLLYRHFRTEKDWVHNGLDQRRTDFKNFLACYQFALGVPIPAEKLPLGSRCFTLPYVVENRRAKPTEDDIELESGKVFWIQNAELIC
jgi:hypothetical protein